ncbi:glycolate oxidase subunit GlcE [Martelella alba]|uniref:Glycolate oxidase subunit GlcE n=1 Tax=Martelella alba TaxID=2590451 RepID=A0A506U324_9HYPH|nr:glycolate oxidase subunit GlcE [Martelella alba]TPW28772.1 glycolate oxidase subunit GlcE [Martelella alba]
MAEIYRPETEEDAADIIADCHDRHESVAIFGGNTRAGYGNPVSASAGLSSSHLSGIVAYNPSEMVMTARSGTPLAEIEAALAAEGQYLAFEPMDHRGIMATEGTPTIGGVFAANVSGPRRFALAGAARDSLLGIRFVNGRGEIIRAGGRVMKNVTGLDLVKLMAGSHGTLGFLTELTFKVLPRPKHAVTLCISGLDDEAAIRLMASVMGLPVEVSGAAHLPFMVRNSFLSGHLAGDSVACLRLEGVEGAVAIRQQKLGDYLASHGPVQHLDAAQTAVLWREIADVRPYCDGSEKPLWRVSVAPSKGAMLLAALRQDAAVDAFYDWQGGLIWMRMDGGCEARILRTLIARHGGGHATLLRAGIGERQIVPAFEPAPAAVATLTARIRATFDPRGIFNPGKMERQEIAA